LISKVDEFEDLVREKTEGEGDVSEVDEGREGSEEDFDGGRGRVGGKTLSKRRRVDGEDSVEDALNQSMPFEIRVVERPSNGKKKAERTQAALPSA